MSKSSFKTNVSFHICPLMWKYIYFLLSLKKQKRSHALLSVRKIAETINLLILKHHKLFWIGFTFSCKIVTITAKWIRIHPDPIFFAGSLFWSDYYWLVLFSRFLKVFSGFFEIRFSKCFFLLIALIRIRILVCKMSRPQPDLNYSTVIQIRSLDLQ